mmetsp:Transcript_39666/g.112501  ORF Transcript_39666/g.112501 Transcript_39666/m.112501 type:complete len:379 (+) Transcript_39666:154-1290(+)|eukprot:CAMPEP_0117659732 /NCGR_PEP_ID=MMETSP0804-20121206/6589_1 /TAXON_ID=1074897 /ORGANISM="Tetraselmis astigmatica, Strain CCMP880" /LENGTH=378 /DNA_ID=CAMNT_0005466409 /DNA_START=107 /DNA_END=1243 /DNA_ORIENTATION=+
MGLSKRERDAAFRANQHHLVKFETKDNVVPAPKTTITRGFEKVAFPKMERELRDEDLVVRQKSLLAARELLGVAECYVQCLEAGVVAALVDLLVDEDSIVRERAAAAFELVAAKDVGVAYMISDGAFSPLVTCLEDEVENVRVAAYKALIESVRFEAARGALIDMGTALPRLVELIQKEGSDLSSLGLTLLKGVAEVRQHEDAMKQLLEDTDAVPALSMLMERSHPLHVQEGAAALLGVLCTSDEAIQVRAVNGNCVKRLAFLLTRGSMSMTVAATSALMAISVSVEGKKSMVREGVVKPVMGLLGIDNDTLCIKLLQLVTNIAEDPEGRRQLQPALETLKKIQSTTPSTVIERCAAHAIRQVTFKTRPYEELPPPEM